MPVSTDPPAKLPTLNLELRPNPPQPGTLSASTRSRTGKNRPPGISNHLEYAFGLDPKVRNTTTNGLPRAAVSNGVFTLTFTRLKAASDLSLTVETSLDLQSWTSAASSRVLEDGLTETIAIERDLSSASAAFFRFRID